MSFASTGPVPTHPRSDAAAQPPREPRAAGGSRPDSRIDAGVSARHVRLAETFARSLGVPARAGGEATRQGAGGASGADAALANFTHAVVHDLHQMAAAGGAGAARSFETFDLPSRLAGLADAAAAHAPAGARAFVASKSAQVDSEPHGSAPVAVEPMPELPNPVTPASATVHLMRVPSSHLLEAFMELSAALPGVADPAAGGQREQLASTLRRLAQAVAPQAAGLQLSGLVLDVQA